MGLVRVGYVSEQVRENSGKSDPAKGLIKIP